MTDIDKRICRAGEDAKRADIFIAGLWPDLSRARVQGLLKEGAITINGKSAKASQAIAPGDEIVALIPPPVPVAIGAEDIPLDIVYEDEDILFVNKPRGMVVHPAVGNYQGTLVNALLHYCDNLSGINGELRPVSCTAWTKDTSGLLVIASMTGRTGR